MGSATLVSILHVPADCLKETWLGRESALRNEWLAQIVEARLIPG